LWIGLERSWLEIMKVEITLENNAAQSIMDLSAELNISPNAVCYALMALGSSVLDSNPQLKPRIKEICKAYDPNNQTRP
jgi:hypothetical protein